MLKGCHVLKVENHNLKSKITDILSSTKPHLLIFPKLSSKLGTKYANMRLGFILIQNTIGNKGHIDTISICQPLLIIKISSESHSLK